MYVPTVMSEPDAGNKTSQTVRGGATLGTGERHSHVPQIKAKVCQQQQSCSGDESLFLSEEKFAKFISSFKTKDSVVSTADSINLQI